MKKVLKFAILTYKKYASPFFPRTCRFYPSCSEYSMQVIDKYGVTKGLFMSIKRIIRCNQYFNGGFDPVK